MTKVYGAPLSPFVRKVLLSLELKGIDYALVPVTPMDLPDDFEAISPLRKIPAFVDDQLTISDSSVICEYLDERYPEPYLRPAELAQRARCRWFEEYADTRLVEAVGPLFWERVIKPVFMGEQPDQAIVQHSLDSLIPAAFSYLESQLQGDEFLFEGRLTLADIAIGSVLINGVHAKFSVAADQYPKLAAYGSMLHGLEVFRKRLAAEQALFGA